MTGRGGDGLPEESSARFSIVPKKASRNVQPLAVNSGRSRRSQGEPAPGHRVRCALARDLPLDITGFVANIGWSLSCPDRRESGVGPA
jgi:hypothetical protein